jgi:hypothetical protein
LETIINPFFLRKCRGKLDVEKGGNLEYDIPVFLKDDVLAFGAA